MGTLNKECVFRYEGKCGYNFPDLWTECNVDKCVKEKVENMKTDIKIDGVGQDAEIVVNEKGGKQSKSPMAMHLVDPEFLYDWAKDGQESCETEHCAIYSAIRWIAGFMKDEGKTVLTFAIDDLESGVAEQMIRIAKVLQFGADKYKANNWRLIPQEEHINHALIHLMAALAGDTQDDHIDHALCRLMMAYATEKSDNFEYGAYVA